MPAVNREIKITYGTLIVGDTTDRLIDGYLKINKSYTSASLSFEIVITASSDAAFASEISTVEEAFRKPFQDLLVEQGASTLLELKPSNNTGLNTMPSISKSGDQKDSGRSRRYSVQIDCELPANNSPTTGLRESTVNVSFSPSRKRRVNISGVVTAEGVSDARAKYNAIISTYTTSVLSALGGTYELGEEPTTTNDYEDKTISFTRIFDEIIYSEAGSSDDVRIIRQVVNITRSQVGPGDTTNSNAARLVNLSCNYEAWIDKDQTQDLRGVWSSIKNWVYTQIQETFASGVIAVTSSSPRYDYTENRITASINAVGSDGSQVIEHRSTIQISDSFGIVLVPAWTGNPMSKYQYQGPASRRRTTTTTQRVLSGAVSRTSFRDVGPNVSVGEIEKIGAEINQVGLGGGGLNINLPGGGAGNAFAFNAMAAGGGDSGDWVIISSQQSETPLTIGTDGKTIDVIDISSTKVEEGFVPITQVGAVITPGG